MNSWEKVALKSWREEHKGMNARRFAWWLMENKPQAAVTILTDQVLAMETTGNGAHSSNETAVTKRSTGKRAK